jgi:hypothetical protein
MRHGSRRITQKDRLTQTFFFRAFASASFIISSLIRLALVASIASSPCVSTFASPEGLRSSLLLAGVDWGVLNCLKTPCESA